MLLIETPKTRAPERDYVIGVLLDEFLGLPWRRRESIRSDVRVSLEGQLGELLLPDVLLSCPESDWLKPVSIPLKPLSNWNLQKDGFEAKTVCNDLPVIYGDSDPLLQKSLNSFRLPIDVFGSAFFMLSRYEEVANIERDEYDRFPAYASLAHKDGFLDRPIVDEYVEVLWAAMSQLWPNLRRKRRQFRIQLSHDVDHTSRYAFCGLTSLMRRVAGDVFLRKTYGALLNGPWARLATRDALKTGDPYNTFDWIMDRSEESGLKSAFYFMTGVTDFRKDGNYDIDHPSTRELIRRIDARGHEIGLHPSFETYLDPEQLCHEADKLRAVLHEEGVVHDTLGGRMHYLRWKTPETSRALELAGMEYDSTLGFADHAGFRCGTCHEYSAFDVHRRVVLELRLRPLIAMERSVISEKYMGLEREPAMALLDRLRQHTKMFDGKFTILWHNSELITQEQRTLYDSMFLDRIQDNA